MEAAVDAHGARARLIRLRDDREIAAFLNQPEHFFASASQRNRDRVVEA
jgi:hypothetical protein